jgi:hypothetical protein
MHFVFYNFIFYLINVEDYIVLQRIVGNSFIQI